MGIAWLSTFLSVFIVSLLGFAGVVTIPFKTETLQKVVMLLVSFSTGALFGDAFIHLLPEAVGKSGFGLAVSLSLLAGIIVFFILEKFIHWRHCHLESCENHPSTFVWMNLIGDALHNFIDGMVIAGSYLISFELGLTTTIAVILHELPQEIGNYGISVHGGINRFAALFYNFGVQLTAFAGAFLIFVLNLKASGLINILIPFTAGGFIYIAGSDLIPEMRKELDFSNSFLQLTLVILGIGLMMLLLLVK